MHFFESLTAQGIKFIQRAREDFLLLHFLLSFFPPFYHQFSLLFSSLFIVSYSLTMVFVLRDVSSNFLFYVDILNVLED